MTLPTTVTNISSMFYMQTKPNKKLLDIPQTFWPEWGFDIGTEINAYYLFANCTAVTSYISPYKTWLSDNIWLPETPAN